MGTTCRELSSAVRSRDSWRSAAFVRSEAQYRVLPPRHDGQHTSAIHKWRAMSSRPRKNISLSENRKQPYISTRPALTEGASRSSRTSSAGCDGRGRAARRAMRSRTVKPCGPGPSTLGSSLVDDDRCRRRGLTSPTPRGEHGAAVKPLRRECRMFRPTCGDYACGPSTLFCPRGCGCARRPAFPAPSFSGGTPNCKTSDAKSRRGNAESCFIVIASAATKSVARVSDLSAEARRAKAEATPGAPAYRCAHAGYATSLTTESDQFARLAGCT